MARHYFNLLNTVGLVIRRVDNDFDNTQKFELLTPKETVQISEETAKILIDRLEPPKQEFYNTNLGRAVDSELYLPSELAGKWINRFGSIAQILYASEGYISFIGVDGKTMLTDTPEYWHQLGYRISDTPTSQTYSFVKGRA